MNYSNHFNLTFCCALLFACTMCSSTLLKANHYDYETLSDEAEILMSAPSSHWEEHENEIKSKIKSTINIVSPVYNLYVRSYLRTYLDKNPNRTQEMLGRTKVFFPIFEQMLREEGMPDQLKFLAVVESALVGYATSRSGAVGLWQFMKPTAREYGLKINSYVDERMDTEKSTRAALKYLKYLHKRFGSWELAMAAYNAGPGRVNSAIRRSGSKDYWVISKYLPRETRAYVPGFIAATYLYHHHADHGLSFIYAGNEWENMAKIRVHKELSFKQISDVTGVPFGTIQKLNNKFFRNYIPQNTLGYDIFLPSYATPYLLDYLNRPEGVAVTYNNFRPIAVDGAHYEERDVAQSYFVRSGDNLYNLARNNGTSVKQIQQWNGLISSNLKIGQRLSFYTKEMVLVQPASRGYINISPIPVKAGLSNQIKSAFDIPIFDLADNLLMFTQAGEDDSIDRTIVIQRRHGLRNQLLRAGIENPDAILEQNGIQSSDVMAGRVVRLW